MAASASQAPSRPPLPWRLASVAVMGCTGLVTRAFICGLNRVQVDGLGNLLGVLDKRKSGRRDRGLLTVCNHVAVLDDPLIWGILPLRYCLDTENFRWSLGAHDICFKNKFLATFFSLGQVLPTHRLWHSPLGGIYQPTMDQAIALLSRPSPRPPPISSSSSFSPEAISPAVAYSTDGKDSYLAPAAYSGNRHAWLHVFPEACCHQSPGNTLRYFKWGVSRFILESEPAPEFIPMFVHGTHLIMPEDREWPRFAPRMGKQVKVVIGTPTDADRQFGKYRAAWKRLVEKVDQDALMHGPEARELRVEVANAVRDEIEKLRVSAGLPPEQDDTAALAETWSKEPNKRRFKSPVDGSMVNRI